MAVPETAMYEYDRLVFRQYYIGLTGQILHMQAVAVSVCMQKPSHQHFGFGVFSLNAAHVITACFLAVHVCHTIKLVPRRRPLQICEYLPLPMRNRGTRFVRIGGYPVAVAGVVRITINL
jgi:hypothetical protein